MSLVCVCSLSRELQVRDSVNRNSEIAIRHLPSDRQLQAIEPGSSEIENDSQEIQMWIDVVIVPALVKRFIERFVLTSDASYDR